MLKRIYIDNFRCLVNFELNVDSINLFLGGNGAGKSTVFDVLRKIQAFVRGDDKVEGIFKSSDCTRWQTSTIQHFELEIVGNGGNYKYELAIGHNQENSRVEYERLWFDNQPLLKFEIGEVQLFGDNYSESIKYSFDWSQSILPTLMPRSKNTKLTWFKNRIERFVIVKIVPSLMSDESEQEETRLLFRMENFVSWYRYISQDQGKVAELMTILKQVLDGFVSFKFESSGKITSLQLRFLDKYYRFNELSDGQKTLIVLYTLIYCTQSEDYTLCIDEPENFLALPEIQPWLLQLYDSCDEGKLQTLLISHHPVLINYLLASPIGYWFERQSNTPVRVKKISNKEADNSGLAISELIERGWLYDPA
ncbi:ATP-binding protein [Dolichospermum sp. UHCC 0684]|uniref:AAA family ATPase n=1 Tax=unclassified Dolichospermum TaxID=2622029 RepID=UPI0014458730|nr:MULTISPECIES: ATP-binding protein [unclassified Dolichospermum]MEA5530132.1 ATP-binding protein [Dolichospermum sp. UHCC 0684]MTJ34301.1 AAA family ATPase [Dolichospermum sp. UHCC 0260]